MQAGEHYEALVGCKVDRLLEKKGISNFLKFLEFALGSGLVISGNQNKSKGFCQLISQTYHGVLCVTPTPIPKPYFNLYQCVLLSMAYFFV